MAGAGISTSAGIPDFRSPTCGLYAKIQQTYKLDDPQQMFEIGYFKKHPKPFYTLAKDLLPEGFHPTPSHYFVKLLHDKGLLLRHYTQNVDGLERLAGVPGEKIVEAHGSFHLSHCTSCGKEYSFEWMREKIRNDVLPMCTCSAIIKPDIIFFGESLPPRFFHCASQDFGKCDLLVIMGTSLVVQPFASLVDKVRPKCPRVLINREKVCAHNETSFLGRLLKRFTSQKDFDKTSPAFGALLGKEGLNFEDSENRDVALLGDCDDQVIKLAETLGWMDDLQKLIDKGDSSSSTRIPKAPSTKEA